MIRFVLYLLVLAAVLYCFFWAIDRRASARGPEPTRTAPPRGPLGPDDDEGFLRDLDRRRTRGDRPEPPGDS